MLRFLPGRWLHLCRAANLGFAAGTSSPRHCLCMRPDCWQCTCGRRLSSGPNLPRAGHGWTVLTFLEIAPMSPRTARGSHGDDDGCAEQRCGCDCGIAARRRRDEMLT